MVISAMRIKTPVNTAKTETSVIKEKANGKRLILNIGVAKVNHEPLKHYLARQFTPDINFIFNETVMDGKRVVLLTIPAAKSVPTAFMN